MRLNSSRAPERVRQISEALSGLLEPAADVLVYGNGDIQQVIEAVRRRRGAEKRLTVVASDVRALKTARDVAEHGIRIEAVVADSLEGTEQQAVDAIVILPSGYEGYEQLRRMVAEAAARLSPGGVLVVLAHARRGATGIERILRDILGDAVVHRGKANARLLVARRTEWRPGEPEPTVRDVLEVEVGGRRFEFATSSGVFSRGQLDQGTRLLLETLTLEDERDILDLGCGYGPIGIVVAATHPDIYAVLVDVDARAVALAIENARRNGVADRVQAFVADGPAAAGRTFDLILSHFPLHVSRTDRERLLHDCYASLRPGGRLRVVTLEQYDLTSDLRDIFVDVRPVVSGVAPGSGSRYVVVESTR